MGTPLLTCNDLRTLTPASQPASSLVAPSSPPSLLGLLTHKGMLAVNQGQCTTPRFDEWRGNHKCVCVCVCFATRTPPWACLWEGLIVLVLKKTTVNAHLGGFVMRQTCWRSRPRWCTSTTAAQWKCTCALCVCPHPLPPPVHHPYNLCYHAHCSRLACDMTLSSVVQCGNRVCRGTVS